MSRQQAYYFRNGESSYCRNGEVSPDWRINWLVFTIVVLIMVFPWVVFQ